MRKYYVIVDAPTCSECGEELSYTEKIDYDENDATVKMEVEPCQACAECRADTEVK